jgi:hypothetical protein
MSQPLFRHRHGRRADIPPEPCYRHAHILPTTPDSGGPRRDLLDDPQTGRASCGFFQLYRRKAFLRFYDHTPEGVDSLVSTRNTERGREQGDKLPANARKGAFPYGECVTFDQ